MRVKAGTPLIDVLRLAYASNQPVLLVGSHGVGKSELVGQAASELGVEHIVRDLSLMEPPDLAGMPVVEKGQMRYAPPSFLPRERGKGGLLVFEELNRAQRYLQAPCLQLLTARQLNDYRLPDGWLPVACINPSDGEEQYHVNELDDALASRFLKVEVVPSVSQWLAWAKNNGIHEQVCEFVTSVPRIFGSSPSSNPRSWSYASNVLKTWESIGGSDETLLASLEGLVGPELSVAFLNFRSGNEVPLKADAIIERYPESRDTILRWKQSGRMDLLKATSHKLQTVIQAVTNWEEAVRNSLDQRANVDRFIKDLPADLRRRLRKFFRGTWILDNEEVTTWMENCGWQFREWLGGIRCMVLW